MTEIDDLKTKIDELHAKTADLWQKNKRLVDEMFVNSSKMYEMKMICMNLTESFDMIYQTILTPKQKRNECVTIFLEEGCILKDMEI